MKPRGGRVSPPGDVLSIRCMGGLNHEKRNRQERAYRAEQEAREPKGEWRTITARYADPCDQCGQTISQGSRFQWKPGNPPFSVHEGCWAIYLASAPLAAVPPLAQRREQRRRTP